MLTAFADLLRDRAEGTAVGAFTAYDLEGLIGTLHAAAAVEEGVIVLLGARSYTSADGPMLLDAVLAAIDRSDARATVQLDHCADIAVIEAALAAGVGAVMADGSELPYEANIEFVARAAELAHRAGAAVEAELGSVTGDEDVALAVEAGALTDPDQAVEFVTRTRADCLAVSIGNVHGTYRKEPQLDFERFQTIHARVSTPLSLHGASGLPDELVARAIALGVAKINVNTELRAAYLEATAQAIEPLLGGSRLGDLHTAQIAAVERVVAAKLQAFTAGARAGAR
jgi:tagatose 1,6-diphosphate aldolase GatY/KbaY